jgi:hypothetical protein
VTRLGANPLASVSVATVPTTRRRSTIHTPQEGRPYSQSSGSYWPTLHAEVAVSGVPRENVSQRNLEHPLRKRNTTTTMTNRRCYKHNKNERKDGARALIYLASELHPEMLVGSRRRAYSSTYFGAT